MDSTNQYIFQDLPQVLVEELLSKSESIGTNILDSLREISKNSYRMRSVLKENSLILKETDFIALNIPTTCGIDGSYVIDKLLSVDLAACAAVAVEGLTPPSEKRYWPNPHFETLIQPIPHFQETNNILRAIMIAFELLLAQDAPHDVVYLDGSLTTPIIYFNQALNKINTTPEHPLNTMATEILYMALEAYQGILQAKRSDHIFCAFPKYSTRRELGERLLWPETFNDRAILTQILEAGELTRPIPMHTDTQWHLNTEPFLANEKFKKAENLANAIVSVLNNIYVFYYKPFDWTPAFRIEIGAAIQQNKSRLAFLLQGTKHQCTTPGIMEPYPLYLADRMVKHLSKAVPAVRQVATQNMARKYEGKMGKIFYMMHGYRTDSGRA